VGNVKVMSFEHIEEVLSQREEVEAGKSGRCVRKRKNLESRVVEGERSRMEEIEEAIAN
jgi:hypothetical protein